MSPRRAFSIAIVVTGMILATYPGSALADVGHVQHHRAPDAAIRFVGATSVIGTYWDPGAWIGGHVRNRTAVHQTVNEQLAGAAPKGSQYLYELKIRNPGAPRQFGVKVGGAGSWPVTYLVGKSDITAALVAGTYQTPVLARGATFKITIEARLGRPGTSLTRLFRVSPVVHPRSIDAVRLRIDYSRCGC